MRNIEKIIDLIKKIEEVSSDYKLAKILGVSTSTLFSWRKRGTVPFEKLNEYCQDKNFTIDFLINEGKKNTGLSMTVNEAAPVYNKRSERIQEIVNILHDHPDLEDHIYHYLKSLITKPK